MVVDLGDFERGGIHNGGVTVRARQKNRIIRRDFIQIISRRKLRRFPKRFDPAAAGAPFAPLGLRDTLFHFGDKIFARVCAFEIQGKFAFADSENVAMRISQTGYDGLAGEIHHPGFVVLRFLRVVI